VLFPTRDSHSSTVASSPLFGKGGSHGLFDSFREIDLGRVPHHWDEEEEEEERGSQSAYILPRREGEHHRGDTSNERPLDTTREEEPPPTAIGVVLGGFVGGRPHIRLESERTCDPTRLVHATHFSALPSWRRCHLLTFPAGSFEP
jgi:hypothetical protein